MFSVPCAWHLTKLGFFGHLGLMDNVAQDLLFLQQLVFVQCLLLAEVVIMLLLVLLQFIQCPLQGSKNNSQNEEGEAGQAEMHYREQNI